VALMWSIASAARASEGSDWARRLKEILARLD